jgi:hypothetical protein
MTAFGGGRGGSQTAVNYASTFGGSGGGGAGYQSAAPALGYAGQGNNGGTGQVSANYGGAGGGGASAAGEDGRTTGGGDGGAGATFNITGTSTCYAGGGGGGIWTAGTVGGATCGGSAGTLNAPASAATANTGGGGGAGGNDGATVQLGGAGGSGVVIISYPTQYSTPTIGSILISPANNSVYPSTTTGTQIAFNCSGDSNAAYLANLTVNGVVNSTSITSAVNASTTWTINSTINGVFIWSVLCYNSTTSTNSSAWKFSFINYAPNISSIIVSTDANQLGPVQANITAQDAENTSLTLGYTWYKNGVNTSNGIVGVINNTPYTLNAGATPYTVGDKWDVLVQVSDGSNASAGNTSANITIMDYATNITKNYTTPQYDTYSYNHYLNLTLNGASDVNAILNYGGANHTANKLSVGVDYYFTVLVTPAQVSLPTVINYTWIYTIILANSSTYSVSNISYLVDTGPGGLVACNATYALISLNFTFFDQETGAPINATFNSIYTGIVSRSITGKDFSYQWCIAPNNGSVAITTSETYTAAGYSPIITTRTMTATNSSLNITIYMLNITSGYPTTMSLQQLPNIPISGQTIIISQYTPPSNYTVIRSCVTGSAGTCLVYLVPNTIYYFYNMSGLNITFGPEVLICTPGSAVCYRNFFVGTVVNIPGVVAGQVTGACAYSNITGYLTCNAAASIPEVTGFGLDLYQLGANTTTCSNTTTGSLATIICHVPQTNNTVWNYMLYSIETVANEPITSGQITVNLNRTPALGRDGWFITLFLFLFICSIGAASPVLGVILGIMGLVLAVFIGVVPFGGMQSIIIVTTVMGIVLIWRLRV